MPDKNKAEDPVDEVYCDGCKKAVRQSKMSHCDECGNELCPDCLTDSFCDGCIDDLNNVDIW